MYYKNWIYTRITHFSIIVELFFVVQIIIDDINFRSYLVRLPHTSLQVVPVAAVALIHNIIMLSIFKQFNSLYNKCYTVLCAWLQKISLIIQTSAHNCKYKQERKRAKSCLLPYTMA